MDDPPAPPRDTTGRRADRAPSDENEELLHRMAACPPGQEREALRERAVRAFLPVARRLARRYGAPIDSREDLYQVACVGLVKAVNRFDPRYGRPFLSYAVPTIDGELKRYLRDCTWDAHVPRSIQEKHRRVRRAQEEMTRAGHSNGGSVPDLHRLTGIEEAEVRLALRADQSRNPLSMDTRRREEDAPSLADAVGDEDPMLDRVVDRIALKSLLPELPVRERRILALYFLDSMSQRQVAAVVGISQMQVSRLLEKSCDFLRRNLLCD
ncbi:sigma-70 family RNA polymerase sigma factor [Streptomyces spinosus]|uniref:sigma-70 family RNA polymerase sigma factor n=1 Tax=Streptomyces spinosus TaxID=2872623 RepID=UPI001CED839C|nr:sigma-70 family RNA polymerase sigma factor [Streptomyces spinosus]